MNKIEFVLPDGSRYTLLCGDNAIIPQTGDNVEIKDSLYEVKSRLLTITDRDNQISVKTHWLFYLK